MLRATVKRLKRIWEKVPEVHCKGYCFASCTNVPLLPAEADYIEEKFQVQLPTVTHQQGRLFKTLGPNFEPCRFLIDKRCSIYEDRPLACRAFGHDLSSLRCPHGCTAARELSGGAFQGMLNELININGKCEASPAATLQV